MDTRLVAWRTKLSIICSLRYICYMRSIVTGVRGQPVEILDESFSSEEACEHAIFLKRILDLLERHGG